RLVGRDSEPGFTLSQRLFCAPPFAQIHQQPSNKKPLSHHCRASQAAKPTRLPEKRLHRERQFRSSLIPDPVVIGSAHLERVFTRWQFVKRCLPLLAGVSPLCVPTLQSHLEPCFFRCAESKHCVVKLDKSAACSEYEPLSKRRFQANLRVQT